MTRPKKIAVDLVPMLPGGDNGGAKIFVLELLRALPKVAPDVTFILLTRKSSDHEVEPLLTSNMQRQMVWDDEVNSDTRKRLLIRIAGAVARRIPGRIRHRLPTSMRLRLLRWAGHFSTSSVISQLGADLLYCPFGGTVFSDATIPMAVTVYDLQYRTYPQFFTPEDRATRDKNFQQACSMSAMAVISDYVRDSVIAQGLVDPNRVFTIHIQIPKRLRTVSEEQRHQVLEKFGLQQNKYFMYPANFWEHKNHKALIFAFEIALRSGLPPDTKLVLTGAPSPRSQEILNDAKVLDIADLIVVPGFVDNTEFSALMMSSLGVVFPSLYEGFGMPVLEAMAMGRPVVCSGLTSLPEVAGDAALFFDPQKPAEIAESMVRLATDEGLRDTLIERGHRRVELFSDTTRMAQQYWQLFELASDGHVHRASTNGIHGDGWAGPQIVLRLPSGNEQRTARIELHLPEWVPHAQTKLTVSSHHQSKASEFTIARGKDRTVDLPIGSDAASIIISVSPYFCPAHIGNNNDMRDLSIIVRRIELQAPDNSIVIFPQAA